MLKLDIARICAEKSFSEPSLLLRSLGFHSNYITAILRQKDSVRLSNAQIERLCLALHCTPSELYSWQPDADKNVAESHPIRALMREKKPPITALLRSMPADQIEQVRELMMQLKKGRDEGE